MNNVHDMILFFFIIGRMKKSLRKTKSKATNQQQSRRRLREIKNVSTETVRQMKTSTVKEQKEKMRLKKIRRQMINLRKEQRAAAQRKPILT